RALAAKLIHSASSAWSHVVAHVGVFWVFFVRSLEKMLDESAQTQEYFSGHGSMLNSHKAASAMITLLNEYGWKTLPHLPHCPDLNLLNVHLIPKLGGLMEGPFPPLSLI
ncbi:hypothetical protein U1Q18_051086, partial [Sarracenia purpurea var. burkii]